MRTSQLELCGLHNMHLAAFETRLQLQTEDAQPHSPPATALQYWWVALLCVRWKVWKKRWERPVPEWLLEYSSAPPTVSRDKFLVNWCGLKRGHNCCGIGEKCDLRELCACKIGIMSDGLTSQP